MKTNSKIWKPVSISGFTGILIGAGIIKSMELNGTEVGNNVEPAAETASNEDMGFREAFDAARAELGPGAVFSWHGNQYTTYTAEEWQSMSEEEQDAFAEQANPEVSPEDVEASDMAEADVSVVEDSPEQPVTTAASDQIIESDDDDVRVVGFGEVQLANGQNITVQEIDYNGQRVAVIDLDQDGEADMMMSDLNHNQQMDEGEVIDLHTGEPLSFTSDEQIADYAPDTFDA